MESLKVLLFLLVSMAEVHNSAQQVPQERSDHMMQLLNEVRSQKNKFEEIAQILKQSPRRRVNLVEAPVDSDLEWEVASQTTSVAPSVRPPSRAARSLAQAPQHSPSAPVMHSPNTHVEIQIVAVNPSIETWGQKCVSWGRKWSGTRFQEVYERDPSYVQWIADRANTLTPPMKDFHMYCQSRQRLEHQI